VSRADRVGEDLMRLKRGKLDMTTTQRAGKSSRTTDKTSKGLSDEERAAMKERVRELKGEARRDPRAKGDGENDVLAKIAEMPKLDRAMAERVHAVIRASAPVLVNGNIGVVSRFPDGRVLSVIGFTVAGGKVVEMDILADPDRLSQLDLPAIES
jgi:hypothetical protein